MTIEEIEKNVLQYLEQVAGNSFGVLLEPGHFLSLAPLAVAFIIGFAVLWIRFGRRRGRWIKPAFLLRMLFPRRIFWHRSARVDYALFLINNGILFFLTATAVLAPALVTTTVLVAAGTLGLHPAGAAPPGIWASVGFTVLLVLVWDFSATYAHYLKHRVPALWEFHKVHHSAEVMTPVTALRRHPVDALFGGFVTVLFTGAAVAVWMLIFGAAEPYILFGQVAGVYLWRLLGYNLRHSHVWISYGPFWSRIFVSPAQHQVHHSDDPAHYDKNFGHIFAFWDRMFGTLYVPAPGERVRFGIEAAEMADFRSLRDVYLKPFVKAAHLMRRRRAT